jgi:putative transposase
VKKYDDKKFLHKSRSMSKLLYHIVFCPKYRHTLAEIHQLEAKKILVNICLEREWKVRSIEVMSDHVHMLLQLPPDVAPSQAIRTLKSISTVYLFTRFPDLKAHKFWGSGLWSLGTFYSSVGVDEKVIQAYVANQRSTDRTSLSVSEGR